jgi:tetratricopeptide (TPR) repeat protein
MLKVENMATLCRRHLGEVTTISILRTVNNLGLLYVDQGKLDEAEKMYMRALKGYEKALGAEHISTLRTVNNLGVLYRDQASKYVHLSEDGANEKVKILKEILKLAYKWRRESLIFGYLGRALI